MVHCVPNILIFDVRVRTSYSVPINMTQPSWTPSELQHPPRPLHLLDQVQTLPVVYPVNVLPHQAFSAERLKKGQGNERSALHYLSQRLTTCRAGVAAPEHIPAVFQLLQREYMLVEVFLKFLICIVDIELLKVVNLRWENIQRVFFVLATRKRIGKKICCEKYQCLLKKI